MLIFHSYFKLISPTLSLLLFYAEQTPDSADIAIDEYLTVSLRLSVSLSVVCLSVCLSLSTLLPSQLRNKLPTFLFLILLCFFFIEIRYGKLYRGDIRYGKFDIYCIVSKFDIENSIYIVLYRISIWSICMYLLSTENQ